MKFNFTLNIATLFVIATALTTSASPNPSERKNDIDIFYEKSSESACHKELYKECGDELKKLKDAIEEVSILGIIGSSLDTASCVTEHITDIVKACTGQSTVTTTQSEVAMFSTFQAAASNNNDKDDDESRCHKALYDLCGDELAALRKAIKDTSPNGIVGASLELAGCITIDFVKLVKACSPFKKSALNELTGSKSSKDLHFDFHDCVEMAKKEIQNGDYSLAGDDHSKMIISHAFAASAIVALVLAFTFVKGYLVGSGVKYCCKSSSPNDDEGRLQYTAALDTITGKDGKVVLLA